MVQGPQDLPDVLKGASHIKPVQAPVHHAKPSALAPEAGKPSKITQAADTVQISDSAKAAQGRSIAKSQEGKAVSQAQQAKDNQARITAEFQALNQTAPAVKTPVHIAAPAPRVASVPTVSSAPKVAAAPEPTVPAPAAKVSRSEAPKVVPSASFTPEVRPNRVQEASAKVQALGGNNAQQNAKLAEKLLTEF